MTCVNCENMERCGGCLLRSLGLSEYQKHKQQVFEKIVATLPQDKVNLAKPVFISDGSRRRGSFNFSYVRKKLIFGFNTRKSHDIVDISHCLLMTPKVNANLENIRRLVGEICATPFVESKGKKSHSSTLNEGDIWICEADNGIDIVLEFDKELQMPHRMAIFELVQEFSDVIRVSHRRNSLSQSEPIIEKAKPIINVGGYDVLIPAGTFLQPSKAGEAALVGLVQKYLAGTSGKIADLFCGVGTFSYPLAKENANKITASDSNPTLLEGFRASVRKNMIPNIEIITRNLFKYPFDERELKGFSAVVFDPPRAGAEAQVQKIADMTQDEKPKKIVAVSCNPQTFVRDAGILISGGYYLEEVAFVDQFIYSDHSELVALFTKE